MKTRRLLSLLLACAMVLSGCASRPSATKTEPSASPSPEVVESASPEPSESPSPEATESASPEPSETPAATSTPEPAAAYTNPLTGEPTDKDLSKTRPVAVMVENNHWDDGSMVTQAGISQAAFLYEMNVESITRNLAIFMDLEDVGEIAPVRSARSYFVNTALAYDAIYVHCGESSDAPEISWTYLQYLVDNDNINIGGSGNSYRIQEAPYYGDVHSMATTGQLLSDHFQQIGTRTEHNEDDFDYGLRFSENAAPTDGTVANNVRIVYPGSNITSFSYNTEKKGYTGVKWNGDYKDRNTDQPAVFQNILVLFTSIQTGLNFKNHSAVATLNYEGTGYFCNGGYAEPITWSRGDYTTPFRYYTADGEELELGVGHTFVAFTDGEWGLSFPE